MKIFFLGGGGFSFQTKIFEKPQPPPWDVINDRSLSGNSHKNLQIPEILLCVFRKIFQVSQFLAKSSDPRKNFVSLPQQTFLDLELTPP